MIECANVTIHCPILSVAFVFVPHWTASLFVVPLICVLYTNLLGTVRFLGLYINPLTYVCVVVSIGLLVDFLIHILLRYYEATPGKSRDDRVKETLETMGVSILVGGLTTFLAAVPLAFSTAEVFRTVFYSFFAMVSLGVTHGLILLPVLLSYFGPTVSVLGHIHHAETHYVYEPKKETTMGDLVLQPTRICDSSSNASSESEVVTYESEVVAYESEVEC